MRPLLALRRLRRDLGSVQLGVDPAHAVLLDLGDPRLTRLLDLFDGTRTRTQLAHAAKRLGLPADALPALLDTLAAAGLLRDGLLPAGLPERARAGLLTEARALAVRTDPADVLRRRWAATVAVVGSDRLGVPLASALACSGVGTVRTGLTGLAERSDALPGGLAPGHSGRSRALAAADAIRRAAPHARIGPGAPSLVIHVGHLDRPARLVALGHARQRTPHLLVTVRDGHIAVGPLIRPGHTACLSCLDGYRTARDPRWPLLAAQLATDPARAEPCEAGLALLAVGHATVQALAQLDGGDPETLDTTVEWAPDGSSRRQHWRRDPDCDCSRRWPGRQNASRAGTMGG
ncbi:TOMM precursor leader peptide-binding protein [Longispora urticae]